jgi:CubicO group peptidase (beta-lactamase class C family)
MRLFPVLRTHLFAIGALLLVSHAATATLPEDRAGAIEKLVSGKMSAAGIPGLSIAVVVEGELAWSRGYGLADLENFVPATPHTAYRTASIGKPMTATAILQLVEEGRLDLDVPVQRYCPTFPRKRWPITTRNLLQHTSGIRHYGGPRNDEEIFNTRHYDSVVEALQIFQDDPLDFEPGTRHHYSTFGYDVLGGVIEGVTGRSYLDYMREHIFAAAGMQDTRDDDPSAIIPHRAAGYLRTPEGTLHNSRKVDMSSKLPAGGFITTVEDLARFAIAVMAHRLVSEVTLERMRTPTVLPGGEVISYGLGWAVFAPGDLWYGEREMFHGGGTPGVSGMLYLLPERGFAVAILTNLEDVPGRLELVAEISRLVLDLGHEGSDVPEGRDGG